VLYILFLLTFSLSSCTTSETTEESYTTPELDKTREHCMSVCMPNDLLGPKATPEELEAVKKAMDKIDECLNDCLGNKQ
jgi:hypothetical protein